MHSLLLRDKLSLNKSLFYSFSHVVVFFTEKVNIFGAVSYCIVATRC